MPIPYLVNPQSDTTPPTHERQTVKRAIGFLRHSDFWGEDAALLQHSRPTASMCLRHTFCHADGQRTVASSEADSFGFAAVPTGFESAEVLRQRMADTVAREANAEEAAEEAKKKEAEKKKQADEEELMEEGDKQDDGQEKGPTDGEDKSGGLSALPAERLPPPLQNFIVYFVLSSLPRTRTL